MRSTKKAKEPELDKEKQKRRKAFYAEWDLGKAVAKRGQARKALTHYLRALERFDAKAFVDPKARLAFSAKQALCNLWSDIAASREAVGDARGALEAINRSLRHLDGHNPTPLFNKGVILAKLKRHRDAIGYYDRAIAQLRGLYLFVPAEGGDCYCAKGESLEALGETERAIDCYLLALPAGKNQRQHVHAKVRLKALIGKVPKGLSPRWPAR